MASESNRWSSLGLAALFLCLAGLTISAIAGAPADFDNDGIPDSVDNCMAHSNSDQCDTNLDGYGNVCDADADDNGVVGISDHALYRATLGTVGPDTDFDCDGIVGIADYAIMRGLLFEPPGPSGLACAGSFPCVP